MRLSPIVFALLSAAAIGWAGEPTPTPYPSPTPSGPSPLSPHDRAVYQLGDPVLIEQEFTDGCGGGAPGDFLATPDRLIRLISDNGIKSIGLAELTPETIRVNVPGTYEIVRFCTSGTFQGEETVNNFTVEAPCPLLNPEPTPAPPGAPVPKIEAYPGAGAVEGALVQVLTLDNSFNSLFYLIVHNDGDADLVIIDILPWIEFDSVSILPNGFVPYTVVRPGHSFYIPLEGLVLKPSVFGKLGMGNFILYVKSNDPATPLKRVNFPDLVTAATQSDIPNYFVFPEPPPANPATPECADQNSDGAVDASDVVNFILQR